MNSKLAGDIQEISDDKISEFQDFLNINLVQHLGAVIDAKKEVDEDIQEFYDLKNNLVSISSLEKLETKVDIGCSFFMKAIVDDPQTIFINVGYGFHLPMSHADGINFIDNKVTLLQRKSTMLDIKENRIRDNMQDMEIMIHDLKFAKHNKIV